jgi:hypothetical protein
MGRLRSWTNGNSPDRPTDCAIEPWPGRSVPYRCPRIWRWRSTGRTRTTAPPSAHGWPTLPRIACASRPVAGAGRLGEGARTAHRGGTRRRVRTCPRHARAERPPLAAPYRAMGGVTYDTGALVAAGHNDRAMWALHAGFLAEPVLPTVPAAVLAEAWRGGGRQASLSRLLAMCDIEPMSDEQARRVGVLAGRHAMTTSSTSRSWKVPRGVTGGCHHE